LKPETAKSKELAARGQKLYRGGNLATGVAACAGCHGPEGAGIPGQYPRISGQFASYLESQLLAFKTGTRANDPNGMMRGVAARMSEAEIKAVAEYASGLR
jgi:cytochrome c553